MKANYYIEWISPRTGDWECMNQVAPFASRDLALKAIEGLLSDPHMHISTYRIIEEFSN